MRLCGICTNGGNQGSGGGSGGSNMDLKVSTNLK